MNQFSKRGDRMNVSKVKLYCRLYVAICLLAVFNIMLWPIVHGKNGLEALVFGVLMIIQATLLGIFAFSKD